MVDITEFLTTVNRTVGREGDTIKYIVIHYTGNKTDKAKSNANFFHSINRHASAHYFVDKTSIYQIVRDCDTSWAVGKKYGNAPLWGKCTNWNSISIEMCSDNGRIADETFRNTVDLTKYLMQKYNVPADRVIRHYDVALKSCPGWKGWIGSDEHIWAQFKAELGGSITCSPKHINSVKTSNNGSKEVIAWGQQHSINFTGHQIATDGIIGKDTKRQMVRVLQHGLNMDYGTNLVEDGIIGKATINALGKHYVKRGEKQYMVTVAEILCNMHGIRTDVECAGIFGTGLERSAGSSYLDAQWFLNHVK